MDQANLFSNSHKSPLAHRMRPASFDAFYGQSKTLNDINNLSADNPFHFVFWGPPGCGKTTLAHLLAKKWEREIFEFSAVTSGVPDLKKLIKNVIETKEFTGKKSIIFIDEIHRFNKSQQDVLLPFLEKGDFTLIGATTEYPQTSLNRAIISRVKLYELTSLGEKEIEDILSKTLKQENLEQPDDFIKLIARYSNGDARIALSHLEYLIESGNSIQTQDQLLEYITQNARSYDKNSNRHYDTISAFIKSVRGSDPDAAVMWLAVMLDGGEDPIFIARRLMILASEDIGNADPAALPLATATHYTVSQIGMPEARISLSQCTIYLACAPKSNSAYLAVDKALAYVRENPTEEVPGHLKNHSPEKVNYKYPHNYEGHFVEQNYKLNELKFYEPTAQGAEKAHSKLLKSR